MKLLKIILLFYFVACAIPAKCKSNSIIIEINSFQSQDSIVHQKLNQCGFELVKSKRLDRIYWNIPLFWSKSIIEDYRTSEQDSLFSSYLSTYCLRDFNVEGCKSIYNWFDVYKLEFESIEKATLFKQWGEAHTVVSSKHPYSFVSEGKNVWFIVVFYHGNYEVFLEKINSCLELIE